MKRILKMAALAWILVLGSSLRNKVDAQPYNDNEVTYQTFYDELSPYGRWIDYPGYGYVWVPDAGPDFRPYSSNGHWVWTDDYEWMWVSDYDWGWAPFHYGRWEEDAYYGWFWVPGYEWSPAWVAWRDGGDYYGWAPLRPGITISINFNIGSYSPPYDYWCFVPRRYITSPRIYDYYVDRSININIINYTTIINYNSYSRGYGYRSGPRRYDAERYCGRINPVRFRDSYTPGRTFYRNNEVSVYRPNVRRENDRSIAPRQVERFDRNNGGFRNRTNDNSVRRDNNDFRGNGTANNGRMDRGGRVNDDQPFRRNDGNVRQPQNNGNVNGSQERRRFDRNDNTGAAGQPDDRRIYNPSGGNGTDNNNRGFERRNNNGNNGNDQIRRRDMPGRQVEPRVQEQPRQFDRRNSASNDNEQIRRRDMQGNNGMPQRQIEPRQQQQPRQFERRMESPRQERQATPQVEQKRQEQPRSFERTGQGNGQQGNKGANTNQGNGRGRGRF